MLKETAEPLSKPHWLNALLGRTFNWLKDPANQKLLRSGAEVAHALLDEGKTPVGH
jgi:hypothetical protein